MGKKKKKQKVVCTKRKKKKQKVVCTKKIKEKQKVVVMMGPKEIRERSERNWLAYNEQMSKSEGFDVCPPPRYYCGLLIPIITDDRYRPCCDLVLLYAKLGLHRYNFLQGKDLQLSSVKKYNQTAVRSTRSYYITLEAATPGGSLQTFQARVDEEQYGRFALSCTIARLLGETKKRNTQTMLDNLLDDFMPELPPENPFEDDTNRFYVLKESELQDNDWIRLYLELAVATTSRDRSKTHSLTNLKILEVAMESTRDLSPFTKGLGAYDAVFYIRYEDSCEARVGKDVDRIAVVRRIVDELSETFNLVGRTQSSQTIIPSNGSAAMETGSSSAQD